MYQTATLWFHFGLSDPFLLKIVCGSFAEAAWSGSGLCWNKRERGTVHAVQNAGVEGDQVAEM